MNIPDFSRAEYNDDRNPAPRVIEGEVEGTSARPPSDPLSSGRHTPDGNFGMALLFGTAAAVVGSLGYALVGLSGFMVSIVAIGVAWLIARAMMTASRGVGGRRYQIAAVVLTYLAVSCGSLFHPLWLAHRAGLPLGAMVSVEVIRYALLGPILALSDGLNGILGAFILAIGLRAAWQMAAGTPGFGQTGGRRLGPFGIR